MKFASRRTFEDSVRAAGLGAMLGDLSRSIRPSIAFQRRHGIDARWPVGASKFGGAPDLPRLFDWPMRPPVPGADRIEDGFRSVRDHVAETIREWMRNPPPDCRPSTQADLDRLFAECDGKIEALHRPFPLAFIAQLDLTRLSLEPGFDPAFPDTGTLAIFEDVTSAQPVGVQRVFWFDRVSGALSPRRPPKDLIAYSNLLDASQGGDPWAVRNRSALLEPFSALSVPTHWRSAYGRHSAVGRRIADWFDEPQGAFSPPQLKGYTEGRSTNFGDVLGGWPTDIQGHVEADMAELAGETGEAISAPGVTDWRLLFSYGGEHYGDDMVAARAMPTDGAFSVMIREEDLSARRFDRAGLVMQST
jgi:hypothetical protein